MTGPAKLELKSVQEMASKVAAKGKGMEKKVFSGLFKIANEIKTISQRDFVPVDEGIMKGSAVVGKPERRGREFRIEVGYGGASEAYVRKQHEDLTLQHTVGEAKISGETSSCSWSQGC